MKPILWDLVNELYTGAEKVMPKFMQDRPIFSAFSMAFVGTYTLTLAAEKFSEKYVNKIIPNFDTKVLPNLEDACKIGIPLFALAYSAVDPDGAKSILMNHPVYTAGMTGAYCGGFVAISKPKV